MAACRKQKQGRKCTLDKDHYGPWHVDERTHTGWLDETLPMLDLPEIKPFTGTLDEEGM